MAASAEQGSVFTITIIGDNVSADPKSRYYFGDWGVRVKASPKAPSVALSFLKSRLDIPCEGAQVFIVRDAFGNTCQNIFDTTIDPGPNAEHWRISHTPSVPLWGPAVVPS